MTTAATGTERVGSRQATDNRPISVVTLGQARQPFSMSRSCEVGPPLSLKMGYVRDHSPLCGMNNKSNSDAAPVCP